jgi:hypothetical protein
MPNDFLAQFQAGFQMGQSRNENARRNQEMQMEAQRQQQQQEMRQAEYQLRLEEHKQQRKALDAQEHATKLAAAKEAYLQRLDANRMQDLPPPTAADVGIPEQGPEMAGPMASQVNVPQPTMAIPSVMQGQPDIQMPVPTGRQQQEMAQAEQQRKMREALGMLIAKEQATQKSPEQIQAESYARARGERMGNPPQPRAEPQGSWSEAVGPDGKPILFNAVTGATRAFPAGVSPKAKPGGTSSGQEKQVLAFYNRAKQATEDIAPIEEQITKAGKLDQLNLQYGYNWMQSPVQQQYRQAQRAFTEARLRKESGAAIAAHEYENDAKVYFAQPGDSPQAVEQKRRGRAKVLDGLRFSAGRAYQEYYGEHAPGAQPSGGGSGIDPEVERAIQEARDKGLI